MSVIQATQRASRVAAIAFALAAFGTAAYGQKPSAAEMATAKELIVATDSTALFRPLIAGVVEQSKLVFLQQNPGLAKDLNEIAAKMRTDLQPRFSELSDELAKLYAVNFTEPELKAILVFYKSPVGKRLLAQQPKVIESGMRFAQDWANKLSDEVVKKMREELKKRGHSL
jgi:uncharacterized protein